MTVSTTVPVSSADSGTIPVLISRHGAGRPVLLLHGGGGPATVVPFADRLAAEGGFDVIVPVYPGFGGTQRPEALGSIRGLAELMAGLLDALDLHNVLVVGNSIGGWVAAELAALASPRVTALVIADAVGLAVEGHAVADFFAMSFDDLAEASYADPDRFRIVPEAMPAAARAVMAANRVALQRYAGISMVDADLTSRLPGIAVPTLVVWGDHDRIADSEVGRAYASLIPGATFVLMDETGHLPQLERPEAFLPIVTRFASAAPA